MEAAIEDASSREHGLVLYGLDINRAAAEEMVQRFNGVGRKLAEKIVANRTEFGLFKDVYDLARVPNVKGKVFQRITGMVWPAQLFRHRELVSKLIGVVGDEIPDVRGVAQRFKELEGFLGCIMIDQDGLVLSKTWEHPSSEALGAFDVVLTRDEVARLEQAVPAAQVAGARYGAAQMAMLDSERPAQA